jgi:hypothetical protein
MKKTWITLIVLAMCATTALFAQERNSKQMIQDRIAYMKANVPLSGKETQNFWPVYEEFLKAEMKAMDAYRKNLEKQGIKLGAPGTNKEIIEKLNDKQLTYLQDQKFELRKNLLNIEAGYHKKFKTILTPQHLQDLYNKEYAYKKHLTNKKKDEKKTETTGPVNTGKRKR